MSGDWLADALDRLADPAATPGVRLGAASIARHEVEQLRTELERRGGVIESVRKLHQRYDGEDYCTTCGPAYHTICCGEPAWPCPTIEALDGEAAS